MACLIEVISFCGTATLNISVADNSKLHLTKK